MATDCRWPRHGGASTTLDEPAVRARCFARGRAWVNSGSPRQCLRRPAAPPEVHCMPSSQSPMIADADVYIPTFRGNNELQASETGLDALSLKLLVLID